MAKKLAEFEDVAVCLSADLFLAIPEQYRQRRNPDDPLDRAWNEALWTTTMASIALERLGDLLRAKAGITEPGPTASFLRRKPGPSDDADPHWSPYTENPP